MRRSLSVCAVVLWSFGFVWLGAARGQTSGALQWTTDSFDPQGDGWQRNETKLTKETVEHMQLLWKSEDRQQANSHALISGAADRSGSQCEKWHDNIGYLGVKLR